MPPASCRHRTEGLLAERNQREKVHLEEEPHVVHALFKEAGLQTHAGVVDQEVERPEGGLGPGYHVRCLRRPGQVGMHNCRLQPGLPELTGGRFELLLTLGE